MLFGSTSKATRFPRMMKTFCFANGLCKWCNAKGYKATICAKAPWNKDKASKNGVIVNKDTKVEGKA